MLPESARLRPDPALRGETPVDVEGRGGVVGEVGAEGELHGKRIVSSGAL